MSYTTANLTSYVDFQDFANTRFDAVPEFAIDQTNSSISWTANGRIVYSVLGNTRFHSNVQFTDRLGADHVYYIHRYL